MCFLFAHEIDAQWTLNFEGYENNHIPSRAPHRTVYGNGRIVGGPYTVTDRTLRTVF